MSARMADEHSPLLRALPVQSTVGQSVKQNWDSSHIENEEEEDEEDWQKKDQMEVQWAEDEKLEETLERRRMEGSSLQVEVMQKVPELVVHERMYKGEKVKRKEESERMACRRIERQGRQSGSNGHRRNDKMGRFESGRDGSTLEEFGGKNRG